MIAAPKLTKLVERFMAFSLHWSSGRCTTPNSGFAFQARQRLGRQDSLAHIEEEFANYDQQFPREQPDR